jgi:hypothetical protein
MYVKEAVLVKRTASWGSAPAGFSLQTEADSTISVFPVGRAGKEQVALEVKA